MSKQTAAISILLTDSYGKVGFDLTKLKRMIKALCERTGIERAIISIGIVNDADIKKVNRKFLKSSKNTDVISFDLSDAKEDDRKVFDMVVNGQRATREAYARGHSQEAELTLYVVHGFLHNVGYDDLKPLAAKRMHKAEDEILQEFGYGRTYDSQRKHRT